MLANFREGNLLFWHQPHTHHVVLPQGQWAVTNWSTDQGASWALILWVLSRELVKTV